MTDQQHAFLDKAAAQAELALHPFPRMAACEAALESNWGKSSLAQANNLFGMKQHKHEIYGTMRLPTREFLQGKWVSLEAGWIVYPSWQACFADRFATLQRLASVYPHYLAALEAPDAGAYVTEVSKTWSTDPDRAAKCLTIYQEYQQQPV